MSVKCTEQHGHRGKRRGFTLPELVLVIIVGSILAAVAFPKLSSMLSFQSDSWRDQVQAALRYAQKSAVAHRRLVCVDLSGTAVVVTIATVRGMASCNAPLAGLDGSSQFGVSPSSSITASMNPSGTIYFQPDGRSTTDAAGNTTSGRTISISGASDLVLYGETGYVQ